MADPNVVQHCRDLIAIDRNKLDLECEQHADVFFNACVELTEAKERVELLERLYKKKRGEIFIQMKKDPIMFNLDNASDKTCEQYLLNEPELVQLEERLLSLQSEVAIRQAFVSALDHRKRMLSDLVTLHGQSYFAKPQGTPEGEKVVREQAKASSRVPMNRPTPTKPKKPL